MDLSETSNQNTNIFLINTKKYGRVYFTYLAFWRFELIINNTKNLNEIEPSEFCSIVAKYLLFKINNISYDENFYKSIKSHNDIELFLEKDELEDFSNSFLTNYISYTDIILIENHKTFDVYSKIKQYFIITKKEYYDTEKRITQFTNLDLGTNAFSQINKILKAKKQAFGAISSLPIGTITNVTKAIQFPTKEIKGFYSNLSDAVTSLNKILYPNISGLFSNISNIAQGYRKSSEDHEYKKSIYNMWNNLEEELRTKDRYFPKSEFLNTFEILIKDAKYYLKKGTVLFRARKISEREFSDEVQMLFSKIMEKYNNQWNNQLYNESDIIKIIKDIPSDDWKYDYINENNLQNIIFWGYGKKESDAPSPQDISIPHGRVNPSGISYLYTARDTATAISEVQPTIGQYISIARIKTLKELNIFNFDYPDTYKYSEIMKKQIDEINEKLGLSNFWQLGIFFRTLSELFTKPILGNTDYYYITQYISEFLKNKGFDGILYKSSLKERGSNIVLFDTSKDENGNHVNYQILNSSIYKIENVKITSTKILPK